MFPIRLWGGLLFLTNLSLVLTGFSSWSIGPLNNLELSFNATVGEVVNKNYFTLAKSDITMFSLGPNGLVKDETIVNKSSISIDFYIDNVNAYPTTELGNLNFDVILTCSDRTFLSTYISEPTIEGSLSMNTSRSELQLVTDIKYKITESGQTKINVQYAVTDVANTEGKTMADLYYANKPNFSFEIIGK